MRDSGQIERQNWNRKQNSLTTPSRTHCAAGFLGSSITPVSCRSSWFPCSIFVTFSVLCCREWRVSSALKRKEWTTVVVMFKMCTTYNIYISRRERYLLATLTKTAHMYEFYCVNGGWTTDLHVQDLVKLCEALWLFSIRVYYSSPLNRIPLQHQL